MTLPVKAQKTRYARHFLGGIVPLALHAAPMVTSKVAESQGVGGFRVESDS